MVDEYPSSLPAQVTGVDSHITAGDRRAGRGRNRSMRSRGAPDCSGKAHRRTTIDAALDTSAQGGETSLMMHRLGYPQMRAAVEPTGGNR